MSALAGRLRAASSLLANRYKVLSAISVFTSYKIKNEKIPLSLSFTCVQEKMHGVSGIFAENS